MPRPLLLLPLLALPGCLERKISVTSDPPGALVTLNNVEIGRTPVEADFTFYGDYDVGLKLPGYEPVRETRTARAPIHEYPPFDLVATALPFDIEHEVAWHFTLTPTPESQAQPDPTLIDRARQLRDQVDKPGSQPVQQGVQLEEREELQGGTSGMKPQHP